MVIRRLRWVNISLGNRWNIADGMTDMRWVCPPWLTETNLNSKWMMIPHFCSTGVEPKQRSKVNGTPAHSPALCTGWRPWCTVGCQGHCKDKGQRSMARLSTHLHSVLDEGLDPCLVAKVIARKKVKGQWHACTLTCTLYWMKALIQTWLPRSLQGQRSKVNGTPAHSPALCTGWRPWYMPGCQGHCKDKGQRSMARLHTHLHSVLDEGLDTRLVTEVIARTKVKGHWHVCTLTCTLYWMKALMHDWLPRSLQGQRSKVNGTSAHSPALCTGWRPWYTPGYRGHCPWTWRCLPPRPLTPCTSPRMSAQSLS